MITFIGCILIGMGVSYVLSRRSYFPNKDDVAGGGLIGFLVGACAYAGVGEYALDYAYRSRGTEAITVVGTEGSGRQAYLREDLSSGTPHFLLYRRDETGVRAMRIPADDRTVIREVPGAAATIETLCQETTDPYAWLWGHTHGQEACRYVVTIQSATVGLAVAAPTDPRR